MAKAGRAPTVATRIPATGANTIWEITAADHSTEFAGTSRSSLTSVGRRAEDAGLKNTDPEANRKATV